MQPLQASDPTASTNLASASHATLASDCNGGAAAELADITMTASMWLSSSDANPPLPPTCWEVQGEKGRGGNIDSAETLVTQVVVAIERQMEKTLVKHHQDLLSSMRLFMNDRVLKESGTAGGTSEANACTVTRKQHSGRYFRAGSGQRILNRQRTPDVDASRVKNGNDGGESPNRWISEGSSRAASKEVRGVANVSGLPYITEDSKSVGSSRSPSNQINIERAAAPYATWSDEVWKASAKECENSREIQQVQQSDVETSKPVRKNASKGPTPKLGRSATSVWKEEVNDTMLDVGALKPQEGKAARMSRCMLSPIGMPRMCWDVLWCFSLAYDMWWSMLLLIFTTEPGATLRICKTLSLVTLAFWTCDVIVNCSSGYVVDGRHIVLDRRAVFLKYARGWLLFDLVATFPWDKIVDTDSGSKTLPLIRSAKASKTIKLVKVLKLLRAIKLLQMGKQSNFMKANFWITKKGGAIIGPLIIVLLLTCLFSHFHGCLWAAVNPDWHSTVDANVALERYSESFWWAYSAITFGTEVRSTPLPQALVEALLCGERLFFSCCVGTFVVLKTMAYFQQNTLSSIATNDATSYLKEHDVGAETQIDVLYSVHETIPAMRKQRNFQSVVEKLPLELKRRICEELWSAPLLTLGLLEIAAEFHGDVIVELAQVVQEEVYAAKAVLCREGDAAIAAYYVLQGKIGAVSSKRATPIPPFIAGNWYGEKALAWTDLTRSATVTCLQYTTVLMVPSENFRELLEKLNIQHVYQEFVENELGFMCGRCGTIGDHNSEKCPSLDTRCQARQSLLR